ncbi:MAG: type VI secretion protein, partial [Oscillospiraceae bacterium]
GEFIENNGRVLYTINILKEKYVKLSTVRYALTAISEGDIVKSINFLEEENYINIRLIGTHEKASISDFNLDKLEAKLSGKGIRLLCCDIKDAAIKV